MPSETPTPQNNTISLRQESFANATNVDFGESHHVHMGKEFPSGMEATQTRCEGAEPHPELPPARSQEEMIEYMEEQNKLKVEKMQAEQDRKREERRREHAEKVCNVTYFSPCAHTLLFR